MARFLAGLVLTILAWVCLSWYEQSHEWAVWLPLLAPPLALLVLRRVRLLPSAILAALALLLVVEANAVRSPPGPGAESVFLAYILHLGLAAFCTLAVVLSWTVRLVSGLRRF